MNPTNLTLLKLIQTVHQLRAPGGCPWDQKQTHFSLKKYLLEEAYETVELLDQTEAPLSLSQQPHLKEKLVEELGDVLLQVLLHAEIAQEAGHFNLNDIAQKLNDKLIRRHPHVFEPQGAAITTSEEVTQQWDVIKKAEKQNQPSQTTSNKDYPSLFDHMTKALPSLSLADKIISQVTAKGFQWPDVHGPLAKIQEEYQELQQEIQSTTPQLDKIENECGDLLFSICNVAHFFKIDPEFALRKMLTRFESRFRYIEHNLHENGKTLEQSNLDEMDQLWNQAKHHDKN